jgi:hypothetical protein
MGVGFKSVGVICGLDGSLVEWMAKAVSNQQDDDPSAKHASVAS